ncbi:MAG: type III-B CRISPR module-associated protein Cmr5 [Thiotrichaceae bacterium]|nr:type III-B CRISPR module-associated protein Cmr5 [Thiotrichaceae bacterium]PCI13444.1 MAG: type III-B CRISPR module-associated protein Cmr5 [Thiotrichales bacterium]
MSNQTIAQQRAKHALQVVCGAKEYKEKSFCEYKRDEQKKLNSYIANLGPMILMNGLGQAAAFYRSNNNKEHKEVYEALADWLSQPGRPYAGSKDLMNAITSSSAAEYRLAQMEALAYLDWLKKFGKAFLIREEDSAPETAEAIEEGDK